MRKLFVMALAISLFMSLGAGTAFAAGGGGNGGGNGKECPPASPGGQENPPDSPPNCGNGNGGNKGGGNCKDKNKKDKHKCPPPDDGCKGKPNCPPKPPEGNCEEADLVVFENAKIVCLYFGEKAPLASKDADCPDALIAAPVDNLIGACVFLPPETDGDGGGGLPGLPGALRTL